MQEIGLLLVAGLSAGVLAGFFGIGGGIILIPFLIYFFKYPPQTASGTSLVALLLPVGILGVVEYYRAGKIGPEHVKAGLIIAVGMFFGAFFGSKFAIGLPQQVLKKTFAVFLVLVATRMWFLG